MTRRCLVLLLVAAALIAMGVSRPRGLADVLDVRHWSYPDYTRVVVELSKPVETKVRHLRADPAAKKSERLYLDLPGIWVGREYKSGIPVGDGLLRSVRLGQNTLRTTRVVIDVEQYDRHRLLFLTHPDRLVIDVYGERDAGSRGGKPAVPDARHDGRLPPDAREVRTVIVDPGHGGADPGAIGVGGLREKDVTLRLSKLLIAKLRKSGFEVVTTRDRDRTVSLEERTAIAEAARGDVFVSLHANAAPRRSVQGIETFYPDANHERHSLRVAMRENGVTKGQLDELQRTLAKLRIGEISPYSQRLAFLVQTQLAQALPSRYGKIQDLGAKKGPFYVLFLSNMPAILIEAGFVTNKSDAKRLRDGDYLDSVATQIATGLERYRDTGSTLARRDSK
ncbi:MAG: N-acetylmuramoyl-L-alanine amidase [Deltaproteobacteria bacterium]|nr:N-acetylmuramoyl-L-alanine amidase [Deltaproteobacteria bacterium]